MLLKQYEQGRQFMAKLEYQSDLLEELNKICREENIKTGVINAIGAIITTYAYDEPMEIVSCSGNISLKDGKPFSHVHIVSADRKGKCIGGHLVQGTAVFAGEVFVQELLGEDLVREEDEETKLTLWK